MKLNEDPNHHKITEIKNDILNLQRKLDDLYRELKRLNNEILSQETPSARQAYTDPLEDTLRRSEHRYRQLVESANRERELFEGIFHSIPVMITIYDPELHDFRCNKEFIKLTGWTESDFADGSLMEKLYPDPDYRQMASDYMTSLQAGWKDFIMHTKDGSQIDSSWANILLKSGIQIGIGIDIREKNRTEAALKENEQRLRATFNHAAIGIVELDAEARFVIVNDRVCEILEYSREELLNRSVLDVTAPEDREQTSNLHDSLFKGETSILNYEKRYIKKNGTAIWVHISISAIRDIEGKYIRSIGTVQNIDQRKVTEIMLNEALREAEEGRNILNALMKYVPLGITIADAPDVRIRMISRYGEELTETRSEDFLGMPAEDHPARWKVFHMDGTTPAKAEELPLTRAIRNGEIIKNVEWLISRQNGNLIPILCHAAPILNDERQITGAVMGWQDITEQKRIEQDLKQKNEELTRFIYTVSHDLKSPLVTIKSFISYLQEDIAANDPEAQSRDVLFIQNAVDRMGKLLDELLELSRIGRKEIFKNYESLNDIVQAALEMVAGRLMQKNIEVVFSGPRVMLFGHSQRLIQLYQNLLDNAAKFMGNQPHPKIEVGAYADKEKGIVMFVRDNGSGIDPQYHHKLFGLFEKLDNGTEGTGIGLALVKRIVEVHGGSIWFHSDGVQRGATFYFTLEKTQIIDEHGKR